tara:strand:+ start:523 stop:789 length:267 start_codon:yes stop_codon:yes gene_type:complete
MKNTIKETTRLLLQGTLTKDEADKILLDLHNVSERYSKEDVRKYGDDWKITTWDEGQQRRRIIAEGYNTIDEAEHDREIFNARLNLQN